MIYISGIYLFNLIKIMIAIRMTENKRRKTDINNNSMANNSVVGGFFDHKANKWMFCFGSKR